MKMENTLNIEQFNWIDQIGKEESLRITALLETGLWVMEWDKERGGFVLVRRS